MFTMKFHSFYIAICSISFADIRYFSLSVFLFALLLLFFCQRILFLFTMNEYEISRMFHINSMALNVETSIKILRFFFFIRKLHSQFLGYPFKIFSQ